MIENTGNTLKEQERFVAAVKENHLENKLKNSFAHKFTIRDFLDYSYSFEVLVKNIDSNALLESLNRIKFIQLGSTIYRVEDIIRVEIVHITDNEEIKA